MTSELDQGMPLGHIEQMGTPTSLHDSMGMGPSVTTPGSTCHIRQSPSPSTSTGTASGSNNNNNRRPPRKSTLTQQQKNQKRQRATQDQLATLEVEFNKNPTPTAIVRDRIAEEINMTERSVQIWFQNRYVLCRFLSQTHFRSLHIQLTSK
jgi:Homeodomain